VNLDCDLDRLLKLRLAVARCGEMDCGRWWNTEGQLGANGAAALRRGFPRTHHFAQARSVFAAASARCAEVFHLPGTHTLWWLGEAVEEAFDLQWERWLETASDWAPFFRELAQSRVSEANVLLTGLGIVTQSEVDAASAFQVDPSGRSVRLPDAPAGEHQVVALLALGFGKGKVGSLVVPYVQGPHGA
jgi:hypothetical protein